MMIGNHPGETNNQLEYSGQCSNILPRALGSEECLRYATAPVPLALSPRQVRFELPSLSRGFEATQPVSKATNEQKVVPGCQGKI